jgi:hypothetical protein
MSKHTKLQIMLGEALRCDPDDGKVSMVLEMMASWFKYVEDNIGIMPSATPLFTSLAAFARRP